MPIKGHSSGRGKLHGSIGYKWFHNPISLTLWPYLCVYRYISCYFWTGCTWLWFNIKHYYSGHDRSEIAYSICDEFSKLYCLPVHSVVIFVTVNSKYREFLNSLDNICVRISEMCSV